MFGPNTHMTDYVDISYSHRDKSFFELFHKTRELMSQKLNLQDYDILFVPGTGTVGIEALMFSLKSKAVVIGNEGTFMSRWKNMAEIYGKDKKEEIEMFCLLETSCSAPFSKEGCVVDAISGFPYYDIPANTIAFVTCLNKQIGSFVGLSVVCVRKDCWDYFISDERMSYLNLVRYKKYHEIDQAPSTSPTFIYEHLYRHLNEFDLQALRKKIDDVSDILVDAIGEENIIGNKRCPVITINKDAVPLELSIKYDLYGLWTGKEHLQIFTYSEDLEKYKRFADELKGMIRR